MDEEVYGEYDTIMSIINHYKESNKLCNVIVECTYSVIEDHEYGFTISTDTNNNKNHSQIVYEMLHEVASSYWYSNIQIKMDLEPDEYDFINSEIIIIIDK